MKNLIIVLLACGLLLGLTACQSTPSADIGESNESESDVTAPIPSDESDEGESDVISTDKDNEIPTPVEISSTYTNPVITHSDEYGQMGDPFVIRYNGRYYLYYTSDKIPCWVSDDLVNWSFLSYSLPDESFGCPWAPEVTYYNGKFYMFAAPNGMGHYAFVSDSPEGPFVPATENLYMCIDGNVLIDDDGQWYFSTASSDPAGTMAAHSPTGIGVYKMTSPISVDKTSVINTGLDSNNSDNTWAEGPMMIKYNGKYYMTYSSHDYICRGYRILYAYGDSPTEFVIDDNNLLLVNTDLSTGAGLGHNSIVLGPNLDQMYIVYHSFTSDGDHRDANIAPLIINGKSLQVYGHHVTAQVTPELPDVYSRFETADSLSGWKAENAAVIDGKLTVSEGGRVIYAKKFRGNYTAEFNFLAVNGKAGAIFDYTDENNYSSAIIDTAAKELVITFKSNGTDTVHNIPVYGSFGEDLNFGVLQCLTVKKSGSEYTFLLNNQTIYECESSMGSGAVGVTSSKGDASFGFVGAEGNVWMSSYKDLAKPIEGEFQAITCIEDDVSTAEHDEVTYLTATGGSTYNYYVNVSDKACFDLGIRYISSVDTTFDIYFNDQLLTSGTLKASDSKNAAEIIRGLVLTSGSGLFTVCINEGTADIFSYEFTVNETVSEEITVDLASPLYAEGKWEVVDGRFDPHIISKHLFGSPDWGDFSLSLNLEAAHNDHKTNILFRASDICDTGREMPNDYNYYHIKYSQSYFVGYFINLITEGEKASVTLNKQQYSPTELSSGSGTIDPNAAVKLRIDCKGANIKVYLNDNDTPVIDYTDPNPIMNGAVGLHFPSGVFYSYVSDMKVSPNT